MLQQNAAAPHNSVDKTISLEDLNNHIIDGHLVVRTILNREEFVDESGSAVSSKDCYTAIRKFTELSSQLDNANNDLNKAKDQFQSLADECNRMFTRDLIQSPTEATKYDEKRVPPTFINPLKEDSSLSGTQRLSFSSESCSNKANCPDDEENQWILKLRNDIEGALGGSSSNDFSTGSNSDRNDSEDISLQRKMEFKQYYVDIKSHLHSAFNALNQRNNEIRRLEKQFSARDKSNQTLLDSATNKASLREEQVIMLAEDVEKLNAELFTTRSDLKGLKQLHSCSENQINHLKAQIDTMETKHNNFEITSNAGLDRLRDQIKSKQIQLNDNQQSIEKLNTQIIDLNKNIQKLEQQQNRQNTNGTVEDDRTRRELQYKQLVGEVNQLCGELQSKMTTNGSTRRDKLLKLLQGTTDDNMGQSTETSPEKNNCRNIQPLDKDQETLTSLRHTVLMMQSLLRNREEENGQLHSDIQELHQNERLIRHLKQKLRTSLEKEEQSIAQNQALQLELEQMKHHIGQLQKEKKEAQDATDAAIRRVTELENDREKTAIVTHETIKKLESDTKRTVAIAEKQKIVIKRQRNKHTEELATMSNEIDNLRNELVVAKNKLLNAQNEINERQQQTATSEKKSKNVKDSNDNNSMELDHLRIQLHTTKKQLREANNDINENRRTFAQNNKKQRTEIDNLRNQLFESEKAKQRTIKEMQQINKSWEQQISDKNSQHTDAITKLGNEINDLHTHLVDAKNQLLYANNEINEKEKHNIETNQQYTIEVHHLRNQLEKAQNQLQEVRNKLFDEKIKQKQKQDNEKRNNHHVKRVEDLRNQLQDAKYQLQDAKNAIIESRRNYEITSSERANKYRIQLNSLQNQLQDAKNELQKAKIEIQQLEKSSSKHRKQEQELKNQMQQHQQQLMLIQSRNIPLDTITEENEEINQLKLQLQQANDRIKELENIAMMVANSSDDDINRLGNGLSIPVTPESNNSKPTTMNETENEFFVGKMSVQNLRKKLAATEYSLFRCEQECKVVNAEVVDLRSKLIESQRRTEDLEQERLVEQAKTDELYSQLSQTQRTVETASAVAFAQNPSSYYPPHTPEAISKLEQDLITKSGECATLRTELDYLRKQLEEKIDRIENLEQTNDLNNALMKELNTHPINANDAAIFKFKLKQGNNIFQTKKNESKNGDDPNSSILLLNNMLTASQERAEILVQERNKITENATNLSIELAESHTIIDELKQIIQGHDREIRMMKNEQKSSNGKCQGVPATSIQNQNNEIVQSPISNFLSSTTATSAKNWLVSSATNLHTGSTPPKHGGADHYNDDANRLRGNNESLKSNHIYSSPLSANNGSVSASDEQMAAQLLTIQTLMERIEILEEENYELRNAAIIQSVWFESNRT